MQAKMVCIGGPVIGIIAIIFIIVIIAIIFIIVIIAIIVIIVLIVIIGHRITFQFRRLCDHVFASAVDMCAVICARARMWLHTCSMDDATT